MEVVISEVWAAAIVTVVGAAASYGVSQANKPNYPDSASSSAALSNVNAQLLPYRRALESLAAQGGKQTIYTPAHTETGQYLKVEVGSHWLNSNAHNILSNFTEESLKKNTGLPGFGEVLGIGGSEEKEYKYVKYNPDDWKEGGKFYGQKLPGKIVTHTQKVKAGPKEYDFTGMGTADIQGFIADKLAAIQLDLSKKYDSQFIDEALKQQKLADPEGFAAREKMNELVQQQINDHPDRPVADLLDKNITDQLTAARLGRLDASSKENLDAGVEAAIAARGGAANVPQGTNFEEPLTTGFAGEARDRAARQKSLAWLSSGATGEDTEYRREQQNLANLSALVNGRTPESQFGSLSGAQQGPTPFRTGQPLPTTPTGQAGAAQSEAVRAAGIASQQVSPWAAALGSTVNIASLLGSAGWTPGGAQKAA